MRSFKRKQMVYTGISTYTWPFDIDDTDDTHKTCVPETYMTRYDTLCHGCLAMFLHKYNLDVKNLSVSYRVIPCHRPHSGLESVSYRVIRKPLEFQPFGLTSGALVVLRSIYNPCEGSLLAYKLASYMNFGMVIPYQLQSPSCQGTQRERYGWFETRERCRNQWLEWMSCISWHYIYHPTLVCKATRGIPNRSYPKEKQTSNMFKVIYTLSFRSLGGTAFESFHVLRSCERKSKR